MNKLFTVLPPNDALASQSVRSDQALPAFARTTMDGFAVRASDTLPPGADAVVMVREDIVAGAEAIAAGRRLRAADIGALGVLFLASGG